MIKRASSSKKNNSSLQRAHTFMHIYRDSVRKWPNGTLWLLLGTCICIQMTGSCRNKVAAALYDRFFPNAVYHGAQKEPLPPGRSPNANFTLYICG